jgi:hypothetical protein
MRITSDWLAAFLFVAGGALGITMLGDVRFGTLRAMGPGFLPIILSCVSIGIGMILGARSLFGSADPTDIVRFHLRPLITVLGGLTIFALLISPVGFVVTTAAMILFMLLASDGKQPVKSAIFAVLAALITGLVFRYGLNMSLRLWW